MRVVKSKEDISLLQRARAVGSAVSYTHLDVYKRQEAVEGVSEAIVDENLIFDV